MDKLDFREYSFNFIKNKITFNDLLLLNKEDFNELGIPLGPRNRILKFIDDYHKEDINNSDKMSTIKRTLKNNSFKDEEDSIKKVLCEEMQFENSTNNANQDNFPGIEYSYNYITSPKFAEKNNNNYQTQNFNVGSFNIVKNKFEVNIPDSQRCNYTLKGETENNQTQNKFRMSNTRKTGIENDVKSDIVAKSNRKDYVGNEDLNSKATSCNYINTSNKNLSLKQNNKPLMEPFDSKAFYNDSKDIIDRNGKVFIKPNHVLGKSNSVVKVNTVKIENDYNIIENKVNINLFYRLIASLEI